MSWRAYFEGVQVVPSVEGLPPGRYALWTDPGWFPMWNRPGVPSKATRRLRIADVSARGTHFRSPEWLYGTEVLGFVVSAAGYSVHHIDGNGWNNDDGNLAFLPKAEHRYLHAFMVYGERWFAADAHRARVALRRVCSLILPPDRGARARGVARSLAPSVTALLGVSEFDARHPDFAHLSALLPEVQRCIRLHWEMKASVQILLNRYGTRSE